MARDLKIEHVAVSDLAPYPRNPRTHSEEQVKVIAASIKRFGWTNPILVGNDNDIIAGHEQATLNGKTFEQIKSERLS